MSFQVGSAANQQGSMIGSNYIVNIIELQNTITSATGLSPIQQVQLEVNQLQQMVNYEQKRIFTNIISKFDTSPIQVTDDINLSNAFLFQNGVLFTGGGISGGGGGTIVSSGGTSIILLSTINPSSTAIAFNVGGRTVFSFDGAGRALYFDPSGTGNRFWVSSATLVADNLQVGGAALGAAPGKFLEATDTLGTSRWSFVSSLQVTDTGVGPAVNLSSSGVVFRTGSGVASEAGRIDSNRNWYLGAPALAGNNDLVNSNDFTVIGGQLRYQGGGVPNAGAFLVTADAQGTVVLCNAATSLSTMIIGDQIQSGATSVRVDGPGQYTTFTQGPNEVMRVTGSGRLGISNTTPAATLDVGGDAIVRGPLTVTDGTASAGYLFTAVNGSGLGTWAPLTSMSAGSGANQVEWRLDPTIPAIKGLFGGSERIRLSTNSAYFGIGSPYMLNVNGIIGASGFASLSPLRFFIGPNGTGTEVGRFADNGNFGIGTTNPLYKLHVAGSQSNEGALFLSTNLTVGGSAFVGNIMTAGLFNGNGSNITNIQTFNVGSSSNRLDIFQTQTRGDILALQIGISTISTSIFSTLYAYNLAGGTGFFSTLSSYLTQTSNSLSAMIGPGAGAVVSTYSTSVGIAMMAQFSTLSSYIVENTVQFSTLSSLIYTTSLSDRAYASTVAFSTASTIFATGLSTFLSTGGLFTSSVLVSSILYAQEVRGFASTLGLGIGSDTVSQLLVGAYTPGLGYRLELEGDIDISGRLFRNGQLYTVDGVPDVYWSKNGSNIYFNDGNVGIGTYTPSYPLDVAGRIRCFGVDVIPGPGVSSISSQGAYVSPWQYQGSNIYYNLGGVGIGTGLNAVSTGVFLDVSGSVRIRNGPTYMSSLGVNIPYGSTLTAAADIYGSLRALSLTVDTTGVFGGRVTARDFLSLSDQRYKKDIQLISDPDTILSSVRGVRFRWKDSSKHDVGLIAQDVLRVLPEAVEGDLEDGLRVSYDKMIPVLLESLKHLQRRVADLEKRCAGLK